MTIFEAIQTVLGVLNNIGDLTLQGVGFYLLFKRVDKTEKEEELPPK